MSAVTHKLLVGVHKTMQVGPDISEDNTISRYPTHCKGLPLPVDSSHFSQRSLPHPDEKCDILYTSHNAFLLVDDRAGSKSLSAHRRLT